MPAQWRRGLESSGRDLRDYADVEAEGEAPGQLSAGDGALWLWYTKVIGFDPVPLGVYDHPAPPADPTGVRSIQISWPGQQHGTIDGLGLRAAVQTTRLNDWLNHRIKDVLGLL